MITLSGVIGAGKTSLTKKLAQRMNYKPFFEPVKHNPILPLFYHGNKLVAEHKATTNPYAFELQIYFLNMRFKMIKEATQQRNSIMDRSIYEDAVFMKMNYELGNVHKEEYKLYKSLLANMMEELPYESHQKAPKLMIYVKVSLKTELKHIKMRGRSYEQIDTNPSLIKYYRTLQKFYKVWYQHYHHSPKMMIDGNKYDFVHNQNDFQVICNQIQKKLNTL